MTPNATMIKPHAHSANLRKRLTWTRRTAAAWVCTRIIGAPTQADTGAGLEQKARPLLRSARSLGTRNILAQQGIRPKNLSSALAFIS